MKSNEKKNDEKKKRQKTQNGKTENHENKQKNTGTHTHVYFHPDSLL